MKKIFCVILAALMLFSLTACGAKRVGGSVKNSGGSSVKSEDAFKFGETNESKYENKFLGLGFKIPDGWSFYNDEQIAEMNGWVLENMDDKYVDQLEDAEYFYDLFTHNADQSSSVNVAFEKGTMSQVLKIDLEELAETTVEGVKDTYENMGFTVIADDVGDIEIDGKEYVCYALESKIGEKTVYQMGFCMKKGQYVAYVSLGASSPEELQKLLDAFYHI